MRDLHDEIKYIYLELMKADQRRDEGGIKRNDILKLLIYLQLLLTELRN